MTGVVVVGPPGRVETQAVVTALRARQLPACVLPAEEPAVAAVALALPDTSLSETITALRRSSRALPLLVVADEVDGEVAAVGLRASASRLLSARVDSRCLADAVHALVRGAGGRETDGEQLHGLTRRERQVIELLAAGQRNDEIAQTLGISYHTARTHVQNVLTKMGLPHRQAVAVLTQRGTRPMRRSVGQGSIRGGVPC